MGKERNYAKRLTFYANNRGYKRDSNQVDELLQDIENGKSRTRLRAEKPWVVNPNHRCSKTVWQKGCSMW